MLPLTLNELRRPGPWSRSLQLVLSSQDFCSTQAQTGASVPLNPSPPRLSWLSTARPWNWRTATRSLETSSCSSCCRDRTSVRAHVGVYCGHGEVTHFGGKYSGGHRPRTFLGSYEEVIVCKQEWRHYCAPAPCGLCCVNAASGPPRTGALHVKPWAGPRLPPTYAKHLCALRAAVAQSGA